MAGKHRDRSQPENGDRIGERTRVEQTGERTGPVKPVEPRHRPPIGQGNEGHPAAEQEGS